MNTHQPNRPLTHSGVSPMMKSHAISVTEMAYTTAICGKWHLGHFRRAYLPTARGFDHQYGHYNGMLGYFTHDRDGGHDWHRDDKACYDQGYSTFLLAEEAVRVIRGHQGGRPLLMYLPFNAVHTPLEVPPQYAQAYSHLAEPRRTYAGMVAAIFLAASSIGSTAGTSGRLDGAGARSARWTRSTSGAAARPRAEATCRSSPCRMASTGTFSTMESATRKIQKASSSHIRLHPP